MIPSAGWLASDQGPPDFIAEVFVPVWSFVEDAPFPTRRSEYRWVANQFTDAPRGTVLDAGAGFNPEIHVLPEILGNLDYHVMAVDANPQSLNMPTHVMVQRFHGDICLLPFPNASYDYWVSVSVLEHLMESSQRLALHEAYQVLKPGGYALMTTDETPPEVVNDLLAQAGFVVGPIADFNGQSHLSPRVAYAIGQKPHDNIS